MGILDFAEKAAGAIAAEKAVEATDSDAGLLEKAVAAVAGYEGVAAVKQHFEKPADTPPEAAAPTDDDTPPEPDSSNSQ